MTEIREITTMKKTKENPSEQVLCWDRRAEVQKAWKAILYVIKEIKKFDIIKNMTNRTMPHTA